MTGPHFRAGVIVVVRRSDGDVLAFERADAAGQWQLPQGGIDTGEGPVEAAWRELGEETGLGPDEVRLVGAPERWTVYELPAEFRAGRGAGQRLGQAHRWFFFDALHDDIVPVPDGREFVAWRWTDAPALVRETAEFRRPGYTEMLGGGMLGGPRDRVSGAGP